MTHALSKTEPRHLNERAFELQRRLEAPLLAAALLTIPALIIEQTHAGRTWGTVASVLDWITWLAFVVEAVDAECGRRPPAMAARPPARGPHHRSDASVPAC